MLGLLLWLLHKQNLRFFVEHFGIRFVLVHVFVELDVVFDLRFCLGYVCRLRHCHLRFLPVAVVETDLILVLARRGRTVLL
jgi:hypothetical protein